MSITASLNGNVSIIDSLNNSGPQLVFQFIQNSGLTDYSYLRGYQVPTSATPIAFPFGITLVQVAYIRNVGSSTDLVVTWTPVVMGGGSNPVIQLEPGAAIIFLEPTLSKGISALSLQSITNPTNVDLIIAG